LRVYVIIIFAFSINILAYGGEPEKTREYGFAFGPKLGFVHGTAFELVYKFPGRNNDALLSELKWDIKPVFYMGAALDFGLIDIMSRPGFFASASVKFGFPGDTGSIENRDWRSSENMDLTDFSSHTNRTDEFYWADIVLGASIPIKPYLYIKPLIAGSWMRFAFTARDGYGIYAEKKIGNNLFFPIDDDPRIESFEGEVIHYEQNWLLLAAGFRLGSLYFKPFSFYLSFQISPLTYCAAVDEHIGRRTTFRDYTGFGLYLEPKAGFTFAPAPFEISLDFSYRYIGRTRGETYIKVGNTPFYLDSKEGGAALSLFKTSFLFKINI
jgi:outer membrane protease